LLQVPFEANPNPIPAFPLKGKEKSGRPCKLVGL